MPRLRLPGPLAAALAGAILYLPTLGHGFTFDDPSVIHRNPLVTGHRYAAILGASYHTGPDQRVETGAYRPLTIASFALNHAAGGLRPAGYHLVNLLLHAAASALVAAAGTALGLSPLGAALGGILFAAHPVHVEAVAGIANRGELLSAAFGLAMLVLWVRGRRLPAALLLLAALLSKESAVAFAAAALAGDVLRRPRPGRTALAGRAALLAAPVLLYLAARAAVLGGILPGAASMSPIENPLLGAGPGTRALAGLALAARAAGLLVAPVRLAPDYGWAAIVPPGGAAEIALGAAVLALVLVLVARAGPALATLGVLGLAAWAVVSNVPFLVGTIFGERLLYLPSVPVCLAAGAALPRLGPAAGRAAAALLVALLAWRSVTYAAAWRDDAALFAHAAAAQPRSVKALSNHAVDLAEAGRVEEARALILRAVALAPDHLPLRLNLAGVLLQSGDLDGAESEVAWVLAREPDNPVALRQRAAISARRALP